jgi:hypothetical protein
MGVELGGVNVSAVDGERRSPECFHGEFTAKPLVMSILRTMTQDPGKLERLEGEKNVHT